MDTVGLHLQLSSHPWTNLTVNPLGKPSGGIVLQPVNHLRKLPMLLMSPGKRNHICITINMLNIAMAVNLYVSLIS